MDSLPLPNDRRLALRITKDAMRHVRAGHPWVFDDSVTSVGLGKDAEPAVAGDLGVIFDGDRRFAAIGLFDPSSPIQIRILHVGKPTKVDQTFWDQAVATAFKHRSDLIADGSNTGYRWINGENDGLGGLIVDRYNEVTVIKAYTAAWLPHLRAIIAALDAVQPSEAIVLRLARNVTRSLSGRGAAFRGVQDGTVLAGTLPEKVTFLENGLKFGVDVLEGQKTGTFLDQRHNRAKVGAISEGHSVLDLFCCTGGFTVAAAAGGARSIHSVDQSPQAIDAVSANLARNELGGRDSGLTTSAMVGDAFEEMQRLVREEQVFGVVVIDPPSFAPRQRDVQSALGAYRRLTKLGVDLVEPGGTLVQASCTARIGRNEFVAQVEDQIDRSGRKIRNVHVTEHDVDHPTTFNEGAYLKAAFVQLS